MAEKSCSLTEFVGTAIGDTLGLVIANVDAALLEAMKLEKTLSLYRHPRCAHRRRAAHYGRR
ncbi:propanediol utilization polyhedral body protein PduB [Klebsiella aerogenes]|nr:propanediol utilization polyhedral body protein PduB [Klebsiella aerogenes]